MRCYMAPPPPHRLLPPDLHYTLELLADDTPGQSQTLPSNLGAAATIRINPLLAQRGAAAALYHPDP
jgi:hypothetical protein